jgi:tetratricopeptide (TPR) repeat protein
VNQPYDERYARAVENARAARAWQDDYDPVDADDPPASFDPQPRSRRFWVMAFLLISLLACVLGAVFVPSSLGFVAGFQELQAQNHELAIQHFNRGLGFLADNYPELAYTEFEIAVKFDGSFAPAQQKLRELQAAMGGQGTPGAQQEDRIAATLYNDASNFIKQKDWSDAITRLEQLRTVKPDYQTTQVNDMLYQAYVAGGKDAVVAGQIELARERFEAALAIKNNDADVAHQRDLAVLYLEGQQAAGYNWQTAIQKFSALYQQDPHYYDVKKNLIDAYTQYAELATRQNASCLAVREYDSALAITQDAALSSQRAQAMALCKQAISATPTPVLTGTENFVFTQPMVNDLPCTGIGDVSGVVHDALGRLMSGVAIGYYADGINLTTTRTNGNGRYQLVWGKDPGVFHVVALGEDGTTPASLVVDVHYPGGDKVGCHWIVDWQRVQ